MKQLPLQQPQQLETFELRVIKVPGQAGKFVQGFAESLQHTSELSNFLIWKVPSSEDRLIFGGIQCGLQIPVNASQ